MTPKAKITPFQFFTILFLSRIFALVTYIVSLRTQLETTDRVIMTVFTAIFLFVTVIPVAVFIKQDNSRSITERASSVSPVFGKILCAVYFAEAMYLGVITCVRFGIFTGSVMFPDTNILFFIFMMLLFSAYIAFKGIESMGRSAVVMLFPVLFSLFFVFATQSADFDILNFTPAFESGTGNILSTAFYSASRTGETALVILMPGYVKNQKPKHFFTFVLLISVVMFTAELVMSGVLGKYGNTQLFSMYSLSVLAQFGFIERLDALFTCVWLLCAGVKISITLFVCSNLLSEFSGRNKRGIYLTATAILMFICTIPLAGNLINLSWLINAHITQILYITAVCVLPITVMIAERIKKNEKT